MVKVRRCRAYVYVWQYVMGIRYLCAGQTVLPLYTYVSHFTHRLGHMVTVWRLRAHTHTHIHDMMCLMYAHPFARQASLPSARAYGHCPMISAVNMIVGRFRAYVFDKMSWTYVCAFASQTVLPLCLWCFDIFVPIVLLMCPFLKMFTYISVLCSFLLLPPFLQISHSISIGQYLLWT